MSIYTEITLIVSRNEISNTPAETPLGEQLVPDLFMQVEEWFSRHKIGPLAVLAGNLQSLEAPRDEPLTDLASANQIIISGGYYNLPREFLEALPAFIEGLPWRKPGSVALILQSENDAAEVYRVCLEDYENNDFDRFERGKITITVLMASYELSNDYGGIRPPVETPYLLLIMNNILEECGEKPLTLLDRLRADSGEKLDEHCRAQHTFLQTATGAFDDMNNVAFSDLVTAFERSYWRYPGTALLTILGETGPMVIIRPERWDN